MNEKDPSNKLRQDSQNQLTDLYEKISNQHDEVLETICPAFAELTESSQRYQNETLIGKGGLKEVYKTYDNRTKRWVAMAHLREDRGLQYFDHFVREAWLISSLSHPNIIKVHDAGVWGDKRPFFTMDLKGNTSLQDLIQNETKLPKLLEIFYKVCDAIAYAHSQGVIHLDLKPQNIQCDKFGEVLVCDWGLGKRADDESEEEYFESLPSKVSENITLLGQVKGTIGYMAPEQQKPELKKDERTDVFALGCILHSILCGEPPRDDSLRQRANSLKQSYPNRYIPDSLEAVVLKAISPAPDDRYSSVIQFRKEIYNYLSGYATEAEKPSLQRKIWLFIARNRTPATISSISLIILFVLSTFFVNSLRRQHIATEEERIRANTLLSEVNILTAEYETLFEQQNITKKELAAELANSANSLKNLGIFDQPTAALEEASRMIQMALQMDPNCKEARLQRFSLNCLQLNYKEAIHDIDFGYNSFKPLVLKFKDYSFDNENRPTTENFIKIFQYAQSNGIKISGHLERLFVYHMAAVRQKNKHQVLDKELNALMEFYNGGPDHFKMDYSPREASLRISVKDRKFVYLKTKQGGSNSCFLRLIPVRTLKVETTGKLTLQNLNRLSIETLDVSKCELLVIKSFPLYLSQLRSIRIRQGQVDPSLLRKYIQSNDPFEIIIEDM